MADYNDIKQSIATNLPDNNNREITAAKLRSTLNEFVDKVATTETGLENEIQGLDTITSSFFQDSIITGVNVKHPINTILPDDAVFTGKYFITSRGRWGNGDYDNDCLLIPIKKGSKVTIMSQPSNRAVIGFVNKSDRPSADVPVIFANGTNSRIEIPGDTKRDIDVTEDCNLYVYNYPGFYPSSIAVIDSNIDLGIGDTKKRLIAEVVGEKVKFGKWRNDQIKLTIPLEFGYFLGSNGQPKFDTDFYEWKRNIFPIKTNGAKFVDIHNSGVVRIIEYDINGTFIKSYPTNSNPVLLDNATAYININANTNIDNVTILLYDFEITPVVSKNNLPVNNDLIGIDLGGGIYTTFNLFLATNYSVDGKPSPLVVYFPPDGGFNNILNGASLSPDERAGIQYLNDEGISVVSVYGWTSYYGIDRPNAGMTSPFPTPIVLDCYNKVIENLLYKYNLDSNCVCAMSYSGGGKLCEYFALRDKKFNALFFCNPTLSLAYAGKSSQAFWDWRCILVDQFAMKNIPSGFIEQGDFDMTRSDFVEWMKDNFDVWGNASPNFINSLRSKDEAVVQYMKNVVAWKTYQSEVGGAYPENGYTIGGELVKIYDENGQVKIGNGTPSFFILCKGDSQAPWQASRELSFNLCNSGVESKCIFLEGEHQTPIKGATKTVTPLLSTTQTSVPYAWRYIAYTIFMKFFKRELLSTEFGDDIVQI